MALPRKLKHFNTFVDGNGYAGETKEVTLPKLSRKMEEYRGGGMDGPISIDMGQEKLELEATYGGLMRDILKGYGALKHDAVLIRFAGAYQREDSGDVDSVEIVVRGRHQEIDMGTAKAGDDSDFKVKSALSYYKLMVNGATAIEIDLASMVLVVDGEDRLAKHRKAIGI
ncbi:phage major tail tube protein [Chitinimonas arctica]|uniref:Phage major tail tube protein n=1 Tax=Chitinimonas arctica TaxID=2594795 RepID=A0A516SHR1_9NEIS|nr:phage major tail tube protein [Chitinimonas arctica]QDQ27692.1 phage major tail tube protein [Chitinimonas arctica]